MVNCINLIIEMNPRFIVGRENVPCVAEVVNRSLKADCTDYNIGGCGSVVVSEIPHHNCLPNMKMFTQVRCIS